jgi:DNA gyrase subunit A
MGLFSYLLKDSQPKIMNLKEQLQCFVDHREKLYSSYYVRIKEGKARAHILEGLKVAVENIDEIVELIKKSEGPAQAKKLMSSIL